MSQWDKLILRILSLASDIRFDEIKKVLASYGYIMRQCSRGSSHYTFRKKGAPSLTIPKHEPIKRTYLEYIRDIIKEEEDE